MIHNNKVYANADEKFVKGTIIYVDDGTGLLFHDIEKTMPVYMDELKELFLNGVIIYNSVYYGYSTPTHYSEKDGSGMVSVGGTEDGILGRVYARPTEE